MSLRWNYGVMTVPQRRSDLLPRTLRSLAAAGFDRPRLFVDGAANADGVGYENDFLLPVTARHPNLRTHGNWVLSLYELYIREPAADRYALFQDDLVCCKNLRAYLEECHYPGEAPRARPGEAVRLDGSAGQPVGHPGYLNLFTMPSNEPFAKGREGWFESNQLGRGAVALVFNRDAVLTLLSARHMVERPMDPHRGHKAVDGGIVESFRKAGQKEYCHFPSLTWHTGERSVMGNAPHRNADSFRGEDWDALSLLPKEVAVGDA